MASLLRALYTFLMMLAMPIILLRLLWKSINLQEYRKRIAERLGLCADLKVKPGGFLIHAVSVGEVVLTIPLINALKDRYPHLDMTLTTTTPTGSQRVKQTYEDAVNHVYMPYDLPWFLNAFLRKVQPACVVIMETEIWPNLINACKQRNIPLIIANGRLSDDSIGRYKYIKFLMRRVLEQVTFVAAQSEIDAKRFIDLGLPQDRLTITGNLKFDANINHEQQLIGAAIKNNLMNRVVWVAASTHAGEEEQVLQAYRIIQQRVPNILLVLIPRHPDRFTSVATLLKEQNFNFVTRSQQTPCASDTEILLGDSMGEMGIYYAMADIAFVGGSLVPVGGHNLLESAALGLATITGHHYHNFKDITQLLHKNHALRIVQTSAELANEVLTLANSDELRRELGSNAVAAIAANRGAIQKLLDIINTKLNQH